MPFLRGTTGVSQSARGPRRARILLALLVGALVLSTLIWVRSLVGWITLGTPQRAVQARARAAAGRALMSDW